MTAQHLYKAYELISLLPSKFKGANEPSLKFTRRDQLVLERVSFHANRYGVYRGGFNRIAKELNCSTKTIQRAFKNLAEIPLITKTRNGGGGINDRDEETMTASEWQLKFEPIPSLPNCFGDYYAKANNSRVANKREKESVEHKDSRQMQPSEERHADTASPTTDDWDTYEEIDGVFDLSDDL